jgi:antitoxin (DNA-binding transcriptional repressor) of toxin-antitoxin stability system
MAVIGTYEAKTHFTHLLKRVAKGEEITIAKHGVPVAVLRASAPGARRPVAEVVSEIKAFSKACKLKGFSLRAMRAEGRD